jgi:hypothetical protein
MANNMCSFSCFTPAGTVSSINMYVGTDPVESIHWRVPPGSRGHLTWYLAQSGVQVLPNLLGVGITADGESDVWVLDVFPSNPTWTFVGNNTGADTHAVYLDFFTGPQVAVSGGGGDILAGFPASDAAIPDMWLT